MYSGEYYAWARYPGRGRLTLGAVRVRLRGTVTRKGRYDTNAKTFALITVVETGREMEVRARELVDFWDSYKREADNIQREREEAEVERHRTNVRNAMIASMMSWKIKEFTGMDLVGQLTYLPREKTVVIPAYELMSWLGITEAEIETAVTKHIEGNHV